MLYLISTPIGNIEDITLRAIKVLKEVDVICAEDSRRVKKLLSHYEIPLEGKTLTSLNEFNIKQKTPHLLKLIKEGKTVALVSDNGTPCISDPGYYLVRECVDNDIEVVSVPGACAAISALTVSGLPTDKFTFLGFFPKKKQSKFIEKIKDSEETVVVYESPYRIKKTLQTLAEHIPNYNIAVCRELTKKFEEVVRGKVKDIEAKDYKGEIVLVIRVDNSK